MKQSTLTFYADGSFGETFDGVFSDGTWYIEDKILYLTYTESQDTYTYPVFIEYDDVSDSFYLYFGDLEEGYEGNNWVFTTYQP